MELTDFDEIKKWLEHGDIGRLAREHGISRFSASAILNGKYKNFAFLSKLQQRAIENKTRILSGQERLKQIGA